MRQCYKQGFMSHDGCDENNRRIWIIKRHDLMMVHFFLIN